MSAVLGLTLGVRVMLCAEAAEPGTGSITGTVRLVGAAPRIAPVGTDWDEPDCGSQPRVPPVLVLGSNQAVAQAIVYLQAAAVRPAAGVLLEPLVVTVRDCEFVPRIQVGRSGAPLLVRNADATLHVVQVDQLSHTNAAQPVARFAAPYAGFEKRINVDSSAESVLLRLSSANGRPWMAAYVALFPHGAAAVTDGAGRFVLRDVPAGSYRLYVWHELLGTISRAVMVHSGQTATVECELPGAAP